MTVEKFARFCHWCVWPVVILVLAAFAFWLFVVEDDSPQLAFGAVSDVYLTLDGDTPAAQIALNDLPKLKLKNVVWLRDCRTSDGEQYLKVDGHSRFDIGIHKIAYPGRLGPVEAKARWIVDRPERMRDLSFGLTGHATFWMAAISTCWGRRITTETPRFEFDIIP